MPLEFRPKYDKIVELLLYLAHRKPGADKYQAVKFFYLADKAHLERYGRPITQERYVALDYGPVASTALDLLNGDKWTMRKVGITELPFETEKVTREGKSEILVIKKPRRDVDFDLFSKSDLRVFDEILAEYGDRSFNDLYEITHSHTAYKRAWDSRPTGARAAGMLYEEMIESPERRKEIVEDLETVASFM